MAGFFVPVCSVLRQNLQRRLEKTQLNSQWLLYTWWQSIKGFIIANFSPAGLWLLFHVITSVFGLITWSMWRAFFLSIFTAVRSPSYDSILLTYIAEQIVNRFHLNLFAWLSIISLCTVSYCICICSLSKFVLHQFFFFWFLTGSMLEELEELLAKKQTPAGGWTLTPPAQR